MPNLIPAALKPLLYGRRENCLGRTFRTCQCGLGMSAVGAIADLAPGAWETENGPQRTLPAGRVFGRQVPCQSTHDPPGRTTTRTRKSRAGGNVMRLARAPLGKLCFKIAHSLATPGKWIAGI